VKQAALLNCFPLDALALGKDCLASAEVDVRRVMLSMLS